MFVLRLAKYLTKTFQGRLQFFPHYYIYNEGVEPDTRSLSAAVVCAFRRSLFSLYLQYQHKGRFQWYFDGYGYGQWMQICAMRQIIGVSKEI